MQSLPPPAELNKILDLLHDLYMRGHEFSDSSLLTFASNIKTGVNIADPEFMPGQKRSREKHSSRQVLGAEL